MLKIVVPGHPAIEMWNEKTERFSTIPPMKDTPLQLEHSLVSISKWEAKWKKPFLSDNPYDKTPEESKDYIRCMTLTQNVDPQVYDYLNNEILDQVSKYIDDSMTATWFAESKSKSGNKEVVTSELIYYWMIVHKIPFECQKWHLNRLMTLIHICNVKSEPPKKMSKREILQRNAKLNAERRKAMNTRG